MPNSEHFHVLLMRHASHEPLWFDPPKRTLSKTGRKDAGDVASGLSAYLSETDGLPELELKVGRILHADSDEARGTAKLLQKNTWPHSGSLLEPCERLNPRVASPYGMANALVPVVDDIANWSQSESSGNAIVVVGHQPLLGWIAEKLTGHAYPINRSEILCLSFDPPDRSGSTRNWLCAKRRGPLRNGKLRWVLSPTDDDTLAELKEKIRAKMESAKLLGAFITTVLGFLLSTFIDETNFPTAIEFQIGFYFSAACFFLAVAFYFAAYFAYDGLLMPRRFWSEPAKRKGSRHPPWLVMRPPSSALWVLYQNMVHVWNRLFTPATLLVFVGLISLAYGVFEPPWPWNAGLGLLVAAATLLAFPIYRSFLGLRIGSED